MHAFTQHIDAQGAREISAQRGGTPELIVVAALRIEAHHQRRLADAIGQRVDVSGQIGTAAFFAAFDENYAARVWNLLLGERLQRQQRTEYGIAVVRAAATIQTTIANHWRPWAE